MTWDVTDLGFRMGLSPRVPGRAAVHVRALVDELLARHGLTIADVDGWAVHPGGPKILDVVQEQLGLDADQAMATVPGGAGRVRQLLLADRAAGRSMRCAAGPGRRAGS